VDDLGDPDYSKGSMKRALVPALAFILFGLALLLGWAAFHRIPGKQALPPGPPSSAGPWSDPAWTSTPQGTPAIVVDYPEEGSIFPPEITPPMFIWHDGTKAGSWRMDVEFSDGSPTLHLPLTGDPPRVGEIDARCVAESNEPPRLAPQWATARSWTPDSQTWETIKTHSIEKPATAVLTGLAAAGIPNVISRGRVSFLTSRDPVGAPIFYRDVPLMPAKQEKGVIQPIAKRAQPLIAWRLRNVAQPRSRLLLENLATCANCHSFSSDGKTLAMDLDGPENDKGAYVIAPIEPKMSIRDEHVMSWNSYSGGPEGFKTIALMSQISPDGRFVVSTVNEAMHVVNFADYRFLQVFYPTRGIIAYYDRKTRRIQALPGADDPRYVQANAVWTPDGKDLIFLRAEAKDPFPKDRKRATYAGDPNETPIHYDLYRMPFADGQGGRAMPIPGGSGNGRSNSFPKVSPNGRWIVFVQSKNGLLMRPDSELYILPIEGGTPRRMRCNTTKMNSWHSFSPNGRWMVFSSKCRSPYTQMFLTHLDDDGRDSPPILIPDATAANRAVNIPEFVNIPPDGLLKIDVPAAELYRLLDLGIELAEKGRNDEAIDSFRKALAADPRFEMAHYQLGVVLARCGRPDEAIDHYRKLLETNPRHSRAHNNLGVLLVNQRRLDEAITHYRAALDIDPSHAGCHANLAVVLDSRGQSDEAMLHYRKAVELGGGVGVHYEFGRALARRQRFHEAVTEFQASVAGDPRWAEAHNNLGNALLLVGRAAEAITQFQLALELKPDYPLARSNLEKARAAAADSLEPTPPQRPLP
jgi:Flp pilus assembly protein TadD